MCISYFCTKIYFSSHTWLPHFVLQYFCSVQHCVSVVCPSLYACIRTRLPQFVRQCSCSVRQCYFSVQHCVSGVSIYMWIPYFSRHTWLPHFVLQCFCTGWRRLIGCLKLQVIFTKEPLIIGLFCGTWLLKIRRPMGLRHPVVCGSVTVVCNTVFL